MAEIKIICCPKCNKRVGFYDGKSTINVTVNCRKCNIRVVYDIQKRETVFKKIPSRPCSSGLTFY